MPFPKQDPRPYTKANVEILTPGQMGVYGLFRPQQWVYVGSGDIRARLLSHLNGDNACITRSQPTFWVAELTRGYREREKELIRECSPTCNVQLN